MRTIRKRLKRKEKDPREETHCLFWVGGRVVGDDGERAGGVNLARNWQPEVLTINPLSHQFLAKLRTPGVFLIILQSLQQEFRLDSRVYAETFYRL